MKSCIPFSLSVKTVRLFLALRKNSLPSVILSGETKFRSRRTSKSVGMAASYYSLIYSSVLSIMGVPTLDDYLKIAGVAKFGYFVICAGDKERISANMGVKKS